VSTGNLPGQHFDSLPPFRSLTCLKYPKCFAWVSYV